MKTKTVKTLRGKPFLLSLDPTHLVIHQRVPAISLIYWKTYFDISYYLVITPYRFKWNNVSGTWHIMINVWQKVFLHLKQYLSKKFNCLSLNFILLQHTLQQVLSRTLTCLMFWYNTARYIRQWNTNPRIQNSADPQFYFAVVSFCSQLSNCLMYYITILTNEKLVFELFENIEAQAKLISKKSTRSSDSFTTNYRIVR